MPEHHLLSFGPFRLDVRNAQLWRGQEVIRLTNKALAVLCYLTEYSGQLVTKDELFAAVWPGVVVSDSALVACIGELRRALGDARRTPQFIETVHGRGYRFLPSVTAQPVASSQHSVVSRGKTASGSQLTTDYWQLTTPFVPLLPLPDKPSIVVLPFVNLSGDPTQEYFSDGLTEILTGDLSQISSLFVIARNSAFTYKGKAVKVQDIGHEMGVRYVLEGGILKAEDTVRIRAQLIDATTGYHLWSERYDRPLQNILRLQDEIVQKIVTTLKLQLTLWEQGILVRQRTDNVDAYDLYLRGLASFFRFTKEACIQAQQLFAQAIELDPQYAEAYASLGGMYQMAGFFQWSQDPHRDLEQAFTLAQQAVTLDDSLPLAHEVLSIVYIQKRQYEQARVEAERTITLAPSSPRGYRALGAILNHIGQAEQAIGVLEQALRLDPRFPLPYQGPLGWAYLMTRRYDEAIATQQKALRHNRDLLESHLILTISYSELGQEAEARAEAAEVLRLSPTYSLDMVRQTWSFKDPADLERTLAALRKAGLK